MKKIIFVFGFTIWRVLTLAQGEITPDFNDVVMNFDLNHIEATHIKTDNLNPVFFAEFAEKMPEFPGGFEAMNQWISKNLNLSANNKPVEGTAYVRFTIDENGKVSDINLLKGLSPLQDRAIINAMRNMPKWIPGQNDGVNIKMQYDLPIKFITK